MLAVMIVRLVKGKLRYPQLHLLALAVTAVEKPCQPRGRLVVLAFKQLDNVLRDIHSSGGVDPRADSKSNVIAGHLRMTLCNIHQRSQPDVVRVGEIH